MTKRFNVSVTDWQADALAELAEADGVSVSHIVRAALRDQLPRLLALSRFLADPSADPEFARQVVGFMDLSERTDGIREFDTHEPGFGPPTREQLEAQWGLQWGGARVPDGDEAPPPEPPTWVLQDDPDDPHSPPSCNTGANP
jgi:hypothetical protein